MQLSPATTPLPHGGRPSLSSRTILAVGAAILPLAVVASGSQAASEAGDLAQFNCIIEPQQTVRLSSPVSGVIAQLDVDRGDLVRKGQVVGSLESGMERVTLALARAKAQASEFTIRSAEARNEFLRRKLQRAKELNGRGLSSLDKLQEVEAEARVAAEQLGEAKANREIALLEVARAEELVRQRTLVSPIDGVVLERLLVPGEYRNEQNPILSLARIDALRVEVIVPTARLGQIRTGTQATVVPEAPARGAYVATVTVVDRVLDSASGTFGVRLVIANPDLALAAGVRCRVAFDGVLSEAK